MAPVLVSSLRWILIDLSGQQKAASFCFSSVFKTTPSFKRRDHPLHAKSSINRAAIRQPPIDPAEWSDSITFLTSKQTNQQYAPLCVTHTHSLSPL